MSSLTSNLVRDSPLLAVYLVVSTASLCLLIGKIIRYCFKRKCIEDSLKYTSALMHIFVANLLMAIMGIGSSLIELTSTGTSPIICPYFNILFIGLASVSACFSGLDAILRWKTMCVLSLELERESVLENQWTLRKFTLFSTVLWILATVIFITPTALFTTKELSPIWIDNRSDQCDFCILSLREYNKECGNKIRTEEFLAWWYIRRMCIFIYFPVLVLQICSMVRVLRIYQDLILYNIGLSSDHYNAPRFIIRYGIRQISAFTFSLLPSCILCMITSANIDIGNVEFLQAITLPAMGLVNVLAYKWNDELGESFSLIYQQSVRSSRSSTKHIENDEANESLDNDATAFAKAITKSYSMSYGSTKYKENSTGSLPQRYNKLAQKFIKYHQESQGRILHSAE